MSSTTSATTTATAVPGLVDGHTSYSPYDYTPSAAVNIFFLSAFSLLSMAHLGFGVKHKTWYFSAAMLLGGIGEIIGYCGRVGSAFDVTRDIYFLIQICCLIIAPAFFSAALYWTMSVLYSQSLPF
jgi:RTA1 like protein